MQQERTGKAHGSSEHLSYRLSNGCSVLSWVNHSATFGGAPNAVALPSRSPIARSSVWTAAFFLEFPHRSDMPTQSSIVSNCFRTLLWADGKW